MNKALNCSLPSSSCFPHIRPRTSLRCNHRSSRKCPPCSRTRHRTRRTPRQPRSPRFTDAEATTKPDCFEVDNKKGVAPPPTRKPSKKGRDSQTRKSMRPPAESTTKRPPNKLNRRVNPKSERLTSERLTLAKNA
ncbi:hypothetical protein MRX96_021927 [Rhipicephalus microplus]